MRRSPGRRAFATFVLGMSGDDESTMVETPASRGAGDDSGTSRPTVSREGDSSYRSVSRVTPSRTSAGSSATTTLATSVVMHSEEATRARAFFRLTTILVLTGAAFMPFVSGPPALRVFAMGCCAIAGLVGLYALRVLHDEKRYTPRLIALVGVVFGVSGELALFYFGLFTAAVMVLPIGVYFFGLSESRMAARTTYVVGALCYFVLSMGVVTGLFPDLGPMPIGHLTATWRAFFVVMTQVVFAVTYFFARSSRRATELALARMERAHRQLNQREALLEEARGELERALQPGEGRFTGQAVAGYLLGEVLGRGGMGEVYAAEHAETHALAAVKLLHPNVLSDASMVQRFVREAELARKVRSPYVAAVLDAGTTDSGLPFVAMDRLVGKDLAWHLRKDPRMSLHRVVELVEHASQALVAIREAGIVHRDMKPHNLMLDEGRSRTWKVLDFGVSRMEGGGATLTQGALVGTPAYMAPEQVRLEAVDHRSDLYALATVAYRALTGKPAFVGEDVAALLYHVVHTAPVRPGATARLPEDVDLVMAIAMAKEREDRFEKVEELARALRLASRGELDAATRERGRRLVAKYPWSSAAARAAG